MSSEGFSRRKRVENMAYDHEKRAPSDPSNWFSVEYLEGPN